jgi:hypothetical protein
VSNLSIKPLRGLDKRPKPMERAPSILSLAALRRSSQDRSVVLAIRGGITRRLIEVGPQLLIRRAKVFLFSLDRRATDAFRSAAVTVRLSRHADSAESSARQFANFRSNSSP